MNRVSFFELSGLPVPFGVVLLSFSFILLLAPYFSGADFGLFKIPDFTLQAKKVLKIIGPVLFLLCVLSFVPLFQNNKATATTGYSIRVTDSDSKRAIPRARVTLVAAGDTLTGETDEDGLYKVKINSEVAVGSLVNLRVVAKDYPISEIYLPFQSFQPVQLTSLVTARNIPSNQIIKPSSQAGEITTRPERGEQRPVSTPPINTVTKSEGADVILNIDGNSTLQDQQLRLQLEEQNQLSKLINLEKVVAGENLVNRAFFVSVDSVSERLSELTLVEVPNEQALPSEIAKQVALGKKFIFSSEVFVNGKVSKIAGFR